MSFIGQQLRDIGPIFVRVQTKSEAEMTLEMRIFG